MNTDTTALDRSDAPRPHAPEAAQSMGEVRDGIDRLDRELVRLLAIRQRYMDAAARIKPERGHVLDRPRIEDVVAKVAAAADAAGLSRAIAEPVWRQLIDRCIAYEFGRFDAREDGGADGSGGG